MWTWRLCDLCNLTTMGLHAMEQRQKKKSGTTLQFYYFFVRIIIYMSYFLISHLHDMSIPGTAVTFLGDMIIDMFAFTYGQIYVFWETRHYWFCTIVHQGSPPFVLVGASSHHLLYAKENNIMYWNFYFFKPPNLRFV